MRLLLVEDNEKPAQALAVGLERSGFSAATARMPTQSRGGDKPEAAAHAAG